ncbi:MAG TPA: hypothetical protein VMT75_12880 [Candidatus Saccharimonadales bacterium]|nr:hypothetical protein [Candidatus Saccharimonadales bacterium]
MFENPTKQPEKEKAGWYTLDEIALVFGMTVQGFRKQVRPLLDAQDIRDAGKKGTRIRARGAIDAYAAGKAKKAEQAAAAKADPMLAGPDDKSGGMERYRLARASQEELNLAVMKKELVNIKDLKRWLDLISSQIRGAGERLVRRFGNEAGDMLNEGLDAAEHHIEMMMKAEGER